MRHLMFVSFFASVGCAEVCPTASESLTQGWTVFNKPTEVLTPPIDDYPHDSPISGQHELFLQWATSADQSQVIVGLDGQSFSGNGTWDSDECGNFILSFGGVYEGDDLSEHAIAVDARMQTWDGHLEGIWDVTEDWKNPILGTGVQRDSWVVQVIGTL